MPRDHGVRDRGLDRDGLAGAVAAAGRLDRQPRPFGRDLRLSGDPDLAALSRHRAADRGLYRDPLRVQPADFGKRARGHARRGIGALVLLSLSTYFLPASNRAFKDLQFEIRNRFVASLLQEGTFTNISDQLTIYIRSRDERGEVVGLLVNDNREPHRPVTIMAERGVFADTPAGSRIVMVNGNRQQFDPDTRKLSLLSFDRYTLDLDTLHDAPVVRFREPQERFLGELFFPPPEADPVLRLSFTVEAHQRVLIPLSALSFAVIPLACLLPGEFNRRGQLKRALLAIIIAFLYELLDIGVNDMASRFAAAIPLMYATNLLPAVLGLGILMRGSMRLGLRRPTAAAIGAA